MQQYIVYAETCQIVKRCSQSGQTDGVQGAAFQFVRQKFRLEFRFGSAAGTTENQRTQVDVWSQRQSAGPLRSTQAFVSGEREKINGVLLHIERADTGRLRRIDRETDPGLFRQCADLSDRLDGSCYVRRVIDEDQTSLGCQQMTYGVKV